MLVTELAAALPVDVLPGAADPSNVSLPQQPLHACLFPGAAPYGSFRRTTNPHEADVGGLRLLATSGQNIEDMAKYTTGADRWGGGGGKRGGAGRDRGRAGASAQPARLVRGWNDPTRAQKRRAPKHSKSPPAHPSNHPPIHPRTPHPINRPRGRVPSSPPPLPPPGWT
jgi:hypothetical protein